MMERLRFRRKPNLGIHYFRVDGAQVRLGPGDVIVCSRAELGLGFLPEYECLDEVPHQSPRIPEIVPGRRRGFFDVVNPDYPDRPLNDKPMRKQAALSFLESFVGSKDNGEG